LNIDTSNLSAKDTKLVLRLLEPLKDLMPFWIVDFEIGYDNSDTGGASIIVDRCYRRAQMFLCRELLTSDESKIERYIAHEIAHCYNEPFQRLIDEYLPIMVDDEKYLSLISKVIDDAIETQTEDLAILFLREDS